MVFSNYNDLLKPSSLDNFQESLGKINGHTFNSLINILIEEKINFEVINGYDKTSEDEDIKEFNKISFKFNNLKDIDKICNDYELKDVFNIVKIKDIYTFTVNK